MTHEEHKEAVALAALGEDVGPEQRDALAVHLAACGECRAELREFSDAAAALAFAYAPARPSPALRSRILAEIKMISQGGDASEASPQTRGTRAVSPTLLARDEGAPASQTDFTAAGAEAAADERAATGAKTTPDAEATATNVIPFDAARRDERGARRGLRPAQMFGYLAASLAIAALSLWLSVLWQRNNQLRADLARLSAQLEETRSQLGQTRTELASARGEATMLAAPDSQVAELTGTEAAEGARARLTFNETTGEAVLFAARLPPPPAGKAYQLWYIADGRPLPGSVFTTDAAGRGQLRGTIPPEGRRAALFAVTLEPAGGVPAPSGEMYLKGSAS